MDDLCSFYQTCSLKWICTCSCTVNSCWVRLCCRRSNHLLWCSLATYRIVTVNTQPLLCILYTNCVWQPPFFVPLIPPPQKKKLLILKNENRSHNKWKSVKTRSINPDLVTSLQSMWVCSTGKAMHQVELEYRWTFYAWTSCSSAVCFEGKLVDMLISYSLCSSVDGY